jgi:chloramphenicol-sensitive protein RarD
VRPIEVLCHRVFWSVLFLIILLSITRRWPAVRDALRSGRTMLTLLASTAMIALNWYVYIYSIATGQVLESSLGYFINPLVSVMLGVVFLSERLRSLQLVGLVLAAAGVANLTWQQHTLPWIALALAMTFGMYGLIRKTTAAGPLVGLMVETTILWPAAVLMLGRNLWPTTAAYDGATYGWLSFAGILTAIPLLWFAGAARRLRLATMGFLQYIAPSVQFVLAITVFREPFTLSHMVTFAMIWAGLIAYSVDSWLALRQPVIAAEAT